MRHGPALGIVGCLALSDELVYILERDPRVSAVLVVDSPEGRALWDKMATSLVEGGPRWWRRASYRPPRPQASRRS